MIWWSSPHSGLVLLSCGARSIFLLAVVFGICSICPLHYVGCMFLLLSIICDWRFFSLATRFMWNWSIYLQSMCVNVFFSLMYICRYCVCWLDSFMDTTPTPSSNRFRAALRTQQLPPKQAAVPQLGLYHSDLLYFIWRFCPQWTKCTFIFVFTDYRV